MKILVIDGQGGKLGRSVIEEILKLEPSAEIVCVGTNSAATSNMLKGGAQSGATGENAVCVQASDADIIAGPIGIVIADSLMGEISARISFAVAKSKAKKVLIPFNKCGTVVVGTEDVPLSELVKKCAQTVVLLSSKISGS